MCILNYDFHILNNAFLIHRPGILAKRTKEEHDKVRANVEAQKEVRQIIASNIEQIYGKQAGCPVLLK